MMVAVAVVDNSSSNNNSSNNNNNNATNDDDANTYDALDSTKVFFVFHKLVQYLASHNNSNSSLAIIA